MDKIFVGSTKHFHNQYGDMYSITLNIADLKKLHEEMTEFTTKEGKTLKSVTINIKEGKKGWYTEVYKPKKKETQPDETVIDPDDLPW